MQLSSGVGGEVWGWGFREMGVEGMEIEEQGAARTERTSLPNVKIAPTPLTTVGPMYCTS